MSSMYLYCAFQSSEEFSALETSFMAISFFAGSSRPAGAALADLVAMTGPATRDAPISARSVRREERMWGVCTGPPVGWESFIRTVRKVSYQRFGVTYTRQGGVGRG
jgi:hypothetical protein